MVILAVFHKCPCHQALNSVGECLDVKDSVTPLVSECHAVGDGGPSDCKVQFSDSEPTCYNHQTLHDVTM